MLLPDETALYAELVEDALGPSVRLEQERVSFSAIAEAARVHSTLTEPRPCSARTGRDAAGGRS
jgi:hypothetical protein